MALETATYISDLIATNPTSTDLKSEGDNHIRLLKSAVKATFPAVTGAVTASHTELNFVDGVTSALQGQLDTKAPLASPALTGTPTAPTAAGGDNSTQIATTAFVTNAAFSTVLPSQVGNSGNLLTTDGMNPSWTAPPIASVSTVSVVTANGMAGTVANPTSTPAITLTTSVTGLVKGNGTALSAATVRTDYAEPTTALSTGLLKNTTTTGAHSIAVAGTDYLAPGGALGTPISGVATNLTGTANGLTAGTATVANGIKTATTTVSVSAATAPTAGQVLTATGTTAATWQDALASNLIKATRATNTILGVADKGDLIHASASYTQTITAAATLGAGWWCLLRVDTGFATTLDPNASELIDGQTTAVLQAGQTYLLACTGTAFTLDRLGVGGYTQVLISGTSWVCPGGVRTIKVVCIGGGGGGGGGHATVSSASGSGGGGGATIWDLSVAPGTSYTYSIGAGGSAGAVGNPGGTGGTTTFTGPDVVIGNGGAGGLTASTTANFMLRPANGGSPENLKRGFFGQRAGTGATSDVGGGMFSLPGGLPGMHCSGSQGLGGSGNSGINIAGTAGTAGAIIIEY